MYLTDLAIRNRITVFVMAAGLMVFGTISYLTLPREAEPDITIPYIIVTTTYRGVSPSDMETSVTKPIEDKLKSLRDVKKITSTSAEGMSSIVIEFQPTIDIDTALQKVRDKVSQAKGDLPVDADDSQISEINISEFPIMYVNVVGDVGVVRLKEIAKNMKDDLETIRGVLKANVIGGLEREIRIEVDPDRLAAYNLPVSQLMSLISSENVNVSGGSIDTPGAKFSVRVPGEFIDPREIETLAVLTKDGKPVYLTDVAKIVDTFKDRTSYARLDGRETVTISVQKRAGENVIAISDNIKKTIDNWRAKLPKGVSLIVSMDRSKDIRLMVADLNNNILTGFILVFLVVLVAMGVRNSIFVALAVPMSLCITFAVLGGLGLTLNFVTLFALVLALGMLVDDAIVVVENIYRHMQEGYSRIDAAKLGASEVAVPVITSSLTTCVAFFPLLFWPDIIGEFMGFMPKTVIIALLASLVVGLIINPGIAAARMKVSARGSLEKRRKSFFLSRYEAFLRLALANRVVTIVVMLLILVGTAVVYGKFGRGVEFFPDPDPVRAQINIKTPEGTGLDKVNEIALEIEKRLEPFRYDPKLRPNEMVKQVVSTVGVTSTDIFGGGGGGENTAQVSIDFLDYAERKMSSKEALKRIRKAMAGIPGAEITVAQEQHGPPVGAPVTVEVSGDDFDTLAYLANRTEDTIKTVPGLVDLKDDYQEARPELNFVVDRNRARLLGLDTNQVAFFLKTAVLGTKVGTFRQGNDEYDITLRLPEAQRNEPDKVERLYVPTMGGQMVPLSSVVNVRYAGGFGSIQRVDEKRVITITGNNEEGYLPTALLAEAQKRLATLPLPPGYKISYTGQNEDMEKAQAFLVKAFVAALFLILFVIVPEFNSVSTPLIILGSVILSLIGVLLSLIVCKMPFGIIMSGIGVISLAGVVVKNAIVLLDFVEKLRQRGFEKTEALVRAGIIRLRPVLLTAITAMLGLLPMVIDVSFDFYKFELVSKSETAQWWRQMATVVFFGLGVATLLTLVIVPVMYSALDTVKSAFGMAWAPPEPDKPAVRRPDIATEES